MIAVDARENQIFLHIFIIPCLKQYQNVLILISIPAFFHIADHDTFVHGDHAFFHRIYQFTAVSYNDHGCSATIDLLQQFHAAGPDFP